VYHDYKLKTLDKLTSTNFDSNEGSKRSLSLFGSSH